MMMLPESIAGAVQVLSVSGGKDSTSMYLQALELDIPFRAVFADTGNEHELTLEYLHDLPRLTGGPAIEWVKADFVDAFARKRVTVQTKWVRENLLPDAKIASTLQALEPSGSLFLDCCKVHGRFPSTKARFCTSELKHEPIFYGVHEPLMAAGNMVVSWQGVRAEESSRRAALPKMDWPSPHLCNYRPLLRWSLADVVATHKRHGIELNPLYQMGMHRVGCMPCIHSRKDEIRRIAELFPDHIRKIAEWEIAVGCAGKRQVPVCTFFAQDTTPQGRRTQTPVGIHGIVEWARSGPGGDINQTTMDLEINQCLSAMGACE
ncbi:MAG: phosphoadenosine phosphosulfate reductase family protein [Magnetococcales bacterium]|nr:phosphoadenosine phosphosulfate reductase family protein [Magnetococcales bacterium]